MTLGARVSLAALAALLVLLYFLSPILTPFVLSAGLAYLGDPLVDRLQRLRLSRTAAVCVVFVVLFGAGLLALILLLPLLQEQAVTFVHNIPDYLRWLQDRALPALGIRLPEGLRLDAAGLKTIVAENWTQAGGAARYLIGAIFKSGTALLAFGSALVLVPVVSFYLLRDWDRLIAWADGMVPPRHQPAVRGFARETDGVLAAFLRGQFLVMLFLAAFYSAGLLLAGLQLGLLIGLVSGLVSFVPYLGFIVGILAAGIAILVQTQELFPLLWVGLVFGIGQILESVFITPWLVGDRIGLHPVAVIFAVLAGGLLFGFIGVLLALPLAAVVAVFLRHAQARWLNSSMYLDG
ncbi:MAG: AI-2E family transporter [Hydrocarboniphaga effusa]|nr:AI-2E family transporter [Hydrocarboniphaga effusa]